VNQYVKYIGQGSFHSKVIVQTDNHTHNNAQPESLKWSIFKLMQVLPIFCPSISFLRTSYSTAN